ncbi:unnamed protein product [Linum trigynum]|uniref:Uncharacterized protein n=1 Tax=Linum trigynum TaxID=586398 RepID=A0AAV2FQX3_9ROSI
MKPTPSLSKAFDIATNEEQQRLISQNRRPAGEAVVLVARRDGDRGHHEHDKGRPTDDEDRPHCSYCHKCSHLCQSCWALIGYPPQNRNDSRDRGDVRGDGDVGLRFRVMDPRVIVLPRQPKYIMIRQESGCRLHC